MCPPNAATHRRKQTLDHARRRAAESTATTRKREPATPSRGSCSSPKAASDGSCFLFGVTLPVLPGPPGPSDPGRETAPVSPRWPLLLLRDPDPIADRFAVIGPEDRALGSYLLGNVLCQGGLSGRIRHYLMLAAKVSWPQTPERHAEPSAAIAAQLADRGISDREAAEAATISVEMRTRARTVGEPCVEIVGYTTAAVDPCIRAQLPRDVTTGDQRSRIVREGSEAVRDAQKRLADATNPPIYRSARVITPLDQPTPSAGRPARTHAMRPDRSA